MALASPQVRAICVEANEFPYLSNQFRVRGVPHTVINRKAAFVGALPEPDFVAAVLEGAGVEMTPHPPPPPPRAGGAPAPLPHRGREIPGPSPQGGREMPGPSTQGGREIPRGPSTEMTN